MSQMQPQEREREQKLVPDFSIPILKAQDPLSDIAKIESPKQGMIEESMTMIWGWIGDLELHANRLRKLRRKAAYERSVIYGSPKKK